MTPSRPAMLELRDPIDRFGAQLHEWRATLRRHLRRADRLAPLLDAPTGARAAAALGAATDAPSPEEAARMRAVDEAAGAVIESLVRLRATVVAWEEVTASAAPELPFAEFASAPALAVEAAGATLVLRAPDEDGREPLGISVYAGAIVRALHALGGAGRVQAVIDMVYASLRDRLSAADLRLVGGRPVWRERLHQARATLAAEGILQPRPQRTWALSAKGRAYVAQRAARAG